MKKNKAKKLLPIALVGLLTLGASAWLSTKETATSVNKIQPGNNFTIVVDNEKSVIDGKETDSNLSLQEMYPMTNAYASANNDYYTFTIDNDAQVAVDYSVVIDADSLVNTLGDKAKITIAEVAADADEAAIRTALANGTEYVISANQELVSVKDLAKGASKKYAVVLAIDESAVYSDIQGNSATLKLRVNAEQAASAR